MNSKLLLRENKDKVTDFRKVLKNIQGAFKYY